MSDWAMFLLVSIAIFAGGLGLVGAAIIGWNRWLHPYDEEAVETAYDGTGEWSDGDPVAVRIDLAPGERAGLPPAVET
jgi:hypothetical protein